MCISQEAERRSCHILTCSAKHIQISFLTQEQRHYAGVQGQPRSCCPGVCSPGLAPTAPRDPTEPGGCSPARSGLGEAGSQPRLERVWLQVWEGRWRVIPYDVLPDWLKDNDYLLHGHRPPMPSFRACFKSIFRIHTETGNIWTHLLGEGSGGHRARLLLAQELCGLCPWEGDVVAIMRELAVSLHCLGARRALHHWCASGRRHRNGHPLWSELSRGWWLRPVSDPPSKRSVSISADALFCLGLWVPAAQPVASGLV